MSQAVQAVWCTANVSACKHCATSINSSDSAPQAVMSMRTTMTALHTSNHPVSEKWCNQRLWV